MWKYIAISAFACCLFVGCDSATQQATITPVVSTSTPQTANYPPKTVFDLHGLAFKGDTSAIHGFHSESVGAAGVCPETKSEVTVDPSVTGQQLAEDLLAYFYAQQLDSNHCGVVIFAYHNQNEANDAYTAGRISVDVTDANGGMNFDPNANNLKYKLTLDTGDAYSSQESIVTY